MNAKIVLTLVSFSSVGLLAALDGKEVFSEDIPEALVPVAKRLLPEPIEISIIAKVEVNDTSLVGVVDLDEGALATTSLPIPTHFDLFNQQLGAIGGWLARQEVGTGITETMTATLAVVVA